MRFTMYKRYVPMTDQEIYIDVDQESLPCAEYIGSICTLNVAEFCYKPAAYKEPYHMALHKSADVLYNIEKGVCINPKIQPTHEMTGDKTLFIFFPSYLKKTHPFLFWYMSEYIEPDILLYDDRVVLEYSSIP